MKFYNSANPILLDYNKKDNKYNKKKYNLKYLVVIKNEYIFIKNFKIFHFFYF